MLDNKDENKNVRVPKIFCRTVIFSFNSYYLLTIDTFTVELKKVKC